MTVRQLEQGGVAVENQYARAVDREGNRAGSQMIDRVFETGDRAWRGIGVIPRSGYRLADEFPRFRRRANLSGGDIQTRESGICISGQVLSGRKKPHDARIRNLCTPESPLGATMVSAEGACSAYYLYGRRQMQVEAGA